MSKYLVVIFLTLMFVIGAMAYILHRQHEEKKVLINNNKALAERVTAYKSKDNRTVSRAIVMKSTKGNLSDSLINVVENMKLKPSKVNAVGEITTKIDTSVMAVAKVENKDTCYNFIINREFTASVCIRTDTAIFHPIITNTQDIAFSDERVFVNKRKSFFLARWLQARQTVVVATVVNSNEAIKTTELTFTYIVK